MKKIIVGLLLLVTILLNAQWSSEPTNNTVVSNLSGDQAIPKIANCSNGDVYIAWLSNATGNYNIRLQRYNSDGEMQWAENGILISDHAQESWITDWDMIADNEGNAILAFNDVRSGNWDIYAYKISADAEFVWGEDGIQLCSTEGMDVAPVIAVTTLNSVVFAWNSADLGDINLTKISSEGDLVWDEAYNLSCDDSYTWPQLLAVDSDAVILKFFEDSGPGWAPTRHVFARKIDENGLDVWSNDAEITTAGGISAWNQIFSMRADNDNGFFIAWHEDRDNNMNTNIFFQHVFNDGTVAFENGSEIVMNPDNEYYYPQIAINIEDEKIFIIWTEMDSNQNLRGVSAQLLTYDGEILWNNYGVFVLLLGANDPMVFSANYVNENYIGIYGDTPYVKAFSLDSNAEFCWDEEIVSMSTIATSVSHPEATEIFNNQVVATWSGGNGIYAQNININGSLGVQDDIYEVPQNVLIDAVSGTVSWDEPQNMIPISYNIYFEDNLLDNVENDIFSYQFENLINGQEYSCGVASVYESEQSEIIIINFIYEGVFVEDYLQLSTRLIENYPNPFNPTTMIIFSVGETFSFVNIEIFNMKGQRVKRLVNNKFATGQHSVIWNGTDENNNHVASGIYYYKLKSGDIEQIAKMLLMK